MGFGSVDELLLHRFDALATSVRSVLHLSAILGTEFDLLDAALAYEEMFDIDESRQLETATALRAAFDVAVEEGILEQNFTISEGGDEGEELMDDEVGGEENPSRSISLTNTVISLKGRRKTHPFYAENRRLRFTHDSWKTSILNVLLDERKKEIHSHVAVSLERELDDESSNQDDFQKQIRVLKHWKASANFTKAVLIALNIGGQLMLLGLNSQAILLFDDVLDILKDMAPGDLDETQHGGISATVLDALVAEELEYLIKVNIAKGKAYSTLRRSADGASAYQDAIDVS